MAVDADRLPDAELDSLPLRLSERLARALLERDGELLALGDGHGLLVARPREAECEELALPQADELSDAVKDAVRDPSPVLVSEPHLLDVCVATNDSDM